MLWSAAVSAALLFPFVFFEERKEKAKAAETAALQSTLPCIRASKEKRTVIGVARPHTRCNYFSNANTCFQSSFMLMTIQPRFFASSYSA